jgi:two-component system chemotaxis family response regulator WspR
MLDAVVSEARGVHRVLLVEDQVTLVEWVRATLAPHTDIALTVCSDSLRALEFAREIKPTLILQDLVMPHVDGFALLARYRADPELTDVPVIVLSSVADVLEKVRAFELGAADYLVKMPHPVELIARVRAQSRAHIMRKERDHLTSELQRTMAQLADSNVKLARAAREDALTGLANRRALDEHLHSEWRRSIREQIPLSFALIDLDFFKLYNDLYGHVRGDECLRTVATAVAGRARRPGDLVARYGGEEIGMLLPHTSEEGSRAVAEGLRRCIEALALPHGGRIDGEAHVTASVGVATLVPRVADDARTLIEAADGALYQAKRRGRNRVMHAVLDAPREDGKRL